MLWAVPCGCGEEFSQKTESHQWDRRRRGIRGRGQLRPRLGNLEAI